MDKLTVEEKYLLLSQVIKQHRSEEKTFNYIIGTIAAIVGFLTIVTTALLLYNKVDISPFGPIIAIPFVFICFVCVLGPTSDNRKINAERDTALDSLDEIYKDELKKEREEKKDSLQNKRNLKCLF